ncbi:MAG TPA: hypothetical protein VEO54_31500 [Thermoanaerobaculia bacterium]|nr:hypothetical protein [Thermoanaerobaculia bacterium]
MKEDILSSSTPAAPPVPLNLPDIQGVIVQGFRSYTHARHFILHIRPGQAAGARQFCGDLLPARNGAMSVTPATRWPSGYRPPYTLSFGVSNCGLQKLLGDEGYATVSGKSYGLFAPFRRPLEDAGGVPGTATKIGDIDDSAPAHWWKNGNWKLDEPQSNAPLDLLITLYARDPAGRDRFGEILLSMIPAGTDGLPSVVPAFVQDSDPLDPPDSIHFGYVDGISQPTIAGYPDPDPSGQEPTPSSAFIINPDRTSTPQPPYTAHPFLANGCFAAFRLLHQDVKAFEEYLALSGSDAELVAAKMCGRWRDGTPLEVSPTGPDPKLSGDARIDFAYLSARDGQQTPPPGPDFDTTGIRCPYASHTRRTHPRDDSAVNTNSQVMRERHRVMRRAFAYGPPYATAPEADRGLVGLFMGASLTDQFEFLMQTWMNTGFFRNPDASPNGSGVDPLFGPQPSNTSPGATSFSYLDDNGAYKQVPGTMTRFVRTDGSLYVFLPGMAGLEHLSNGTIPPGA